MATEEDEKGRNESVHSGSDDGHSNESGSDSDSNSDSSEVAPVEWLATGRSKRSTAGNRMKSMLANEEQAADDSDLELLFAEDEDDAGFSDAGKDDASDAQMDSSSDDEDQEGDADEMEGEKELQRQAKEKKLAQRKRKAQEAIPMKFRKKVRIVQPSASSQSPAPSGAPQPRPKKKSERMSWLPTASEAPTRASERRTTKLSKEQLHQQMVEREAKRKKQMEIFEKKAKRLEALKKPPMTQAERLAEAAIVEKRNSKSLNRWEEAEKQREEERLQKIAALKSRKLDGPVVTFWSGIQELEEGQLKHIGKMVSMEEKAPRKKRQSAAEKAAALQDAEGQTAEPESKSMEMTEAKPDAQLESQPPLQDSGAAIQDSNTAAMPVESSAVENADPPAPTAPEPISDDPNQAQEPQPSAPQPSSSLALPETEASLSPPSGLMVPPPIPPPPAVAPGVLAAPVLAPPLGVASGDLDNQASVAGFSAPSVKSNFLAAPNTSHGSSPPSPAPVAAEQALNATNSSLAPTTATPPATVHFADSLIADSAPLEETHDSNPTAALNTALEAEAEPPLEGKVTKSCIILQNFNENAIKDRQVQTQILFGRKMNKLAKPAHAPVCVITNHPARYRDPSTRLPFYNSRAFREIQRLHRGDYKYSRLLGTWVGTGAVAAKGVPERFLNPDAKGPEKKPEMEKKVEGDGEQAVEKGKENGEGEDVGDAAAPLPLPAAATA